MTYVESRNNEINQLGTFRAPQNKMTPTWSSESRRGSSRNSNNSPEETATLKAKRRERSRQSFYSAPEESKSNTVQTMTVEKTVGSNIDKPVPPRSAPTKGEIPARKATKPNRGFKAKNYSLGAIARQEKLSLSDFAVIADQKNSASYAGCLELIEQIDGEFPPTDKQLYKIIASALRANLSEQHINDLLDRIKKKWKSCTLKILKEMRETIQMCVNFDGPADAEADAEAKGNRKGCNTTDDAFKEQKDYALRGLKEGNLVNPQAFRYGSELAQLHHIPEEGTLWIEVMSNSGLREEINRCCDFEKTNLTDGDAIGVSVPTDVVSDLIQIKSRLPVPYLRQVVNYPVFDKDAQLIASNGYHANGYLYLKLPDELSIPTVSSHPSDDERCEAVRLLIEEYLGDFPFDGYSRRELLVACGIEPADAGESKKPVPPSLLSFLAFLIQPLVRPVIGKSPLPALLMTKPAAGSGATKLIETAQMIVLGHTSTRAALPNNDEERRKGIFSALRAGSPYMLFDNVTGSIDSPVLAALLTSVMFTDRVLGKSEERTIPNLASVVITGNNPTLSKELLRRVSLCRIDAGVAEPDKRQDFRHNHLEVWVSENRGKLLWALCTLVAHWKAEGCPAPAGLLLASYGPWHKTCGGIFEATGWAGFQSNRHQLEQVAGNDEEDPIRNLIQRWFEASINPATEFKLKDQYVGGDYGLAALADSSELSLPVKRKRVDDEIKFDPSALGQFLASNVDKTFNIDGETRVMLCAGPKTKLGKPWSLIAKAASGSVAVN